MVINPCFVSANDPLQESILLDLLAADTPEDAVSSARSREIHFANTFRRPRQTGLQSFVHKKALLFLFMSKDSSYLFQLQTQFRTPLGEDLVQ